MPVIMKHEHHGLGYKPNAKNRSKMMRLKREKRIASLVGATVDVLPHLRETFYSARLEHDDIRPSGTAILEEFEKMTINAIEDVKVKREDVRAMVPQCHSESHQRTRLPQIFLLFSYFHNN